MTRFKELCLDINDDARPVGEFWAALSGLTYEPGDDPVDGDLAGEQEGMGIALCPVPEGKTVKNRVHLDVSVSSLDDVTALGGTIGESHEHWTICQDPAGNELCAFVREDELPPHRTFEVVVDSAEPREIAAWWAEVFGVEAQCKGEFWWIQDVDGFPTAGPFFAMVFAPVPEPKTVKNRLHWDVYGDPAELEAKGARRLSEMPRWTVMADPEGNEFCVFPG